MTLSSNDNVLMRTLLSTIYTFIRTQSSLFRKNKSVLFLERMTNKQVLPAKLEVLLDEPGGVQSGF